MLLAALGAGLATAATPPAAADAAPLFSIADPRIGDPTGIALAPGHPGVLLTVDGGGGPAEVFAVDLAGHTIAVLGLTGATDVGWSAIAVGPGSDVWVGDLGDPAGDRQNVDVYEFQLPAELTDGPVAATRYTLGYRDGPHDVQALLVQPTTGRIYVVTDASTGSGIYTTDGPLTSTGVNPLSRIGSAPAGVTDGAFAPSGTALVLRGATTATLLAWPSLATEHTIALPVQTQGGSVTFTADGAAVLAAGQGVGGQVYRVALTGAAAPAVASSAPTPTPTVVSVPTVVESIHAETSLQSDPLVSRALRRWLPEIAAAVAILAALVAFPRRRRPPAHRRR